MLIASACTGGDGPGSPVASAVTTTTTAVSSSTTTSTTVVTPGTLDRASEVLLSRWSDRDAFFAVSAALDAGYSGRQVVDHAADLGFDGSIPGVDPDGSPSGLLSPTSPDGSPPPNALGGGGSGIFGAPAGVFAGGGEDPVDQWVATADLWLGEMFDRAIERAQAEQREEDAITVFVIGLALQGYSVEQILAGLSNGSASTVPGTEQTDGEAHKCFFIEGELPAGSGETPPGCVPPTSPDYPAIAVELEALGLVVTEYLRVGEPIFAVVTFDGFDSDPEAAAEELVDALLDTTFTWFLDDMLVVEESSGQYWYEFHAFDEPGTHTVEVDFTGDLEGSYSSEVMVLPAFAADRGPLLLPAIDEGLVEVSPGSEFDAVVFAGESTEWVVVVEGASEKPQFEWAFPEGMAGSGVTLATTVPEGAGDDFITAWVIQNTFATPGPATVSVRITDPNTFTVDDSDNASPETVELEWEVLVVEPPENPNFWGGGESCAGEGEGTEYGQQWSVFMTEDGGSWTADIYYHDCPNGGRAHYRGEATQITPYRWSATVELVDARGPLGGVASADAPGPIEYYLVSGQDIDPNIQQTLGVN